MSYTAVEPSSFRSAVQYQAGLRDRPIHHTSSATILAAAGVGTRVVYWQGLYLQCILSVESVPVPLQVWTPLIARSTTSVRSTEWIRARDPIDDTDLPTAVTSPSPTVLQARNSWSGRTRQFASGFLAASSLTTQSEPTTVLPATAVPLQLMH